jgi:hypothetical protein
MGIGAKICYHLRNPGPDGFYAASNHGFGAVDKEIDRKTAVHGILWVMS